MHPEILCDCDYTNGAMVHQLNHLKVGYLLTAGISSKCEIKF